MVRSNGLVYLSIIFIVIVILFLRFMLHLYPNSNYLIHCWGGIHHPVSIIGVLWSHQSHRHCTVMTLYWFHGACLGLTTSISGWQSLQLMRATATDGYFVWPFHWPINHPEVLHRYKESQWGSSNGFKPGLNLISLCMNKSHFHFYASNRILHAGQKLFFPPCRVGQTAGFGASSAIELHVSSLLNMAAYINNVKTICLFFPLFPSSTLLLEQKSLAGML